MRPPRQTWHSHFMHMAHLVAGQSTCARRAVGCVVVDARNRVLATGFNGVPPGVDHCYDNNPGVDVKVCDGALAPSGTKLDSCKANHAESNALIQCSRPDDAVACYLTCSPCMSCIKMLMCTGIAHLYFGEEYPHQEAKDLWLSTPLRIKTRSGSQFYQRSWTLMKHLKSGVWVPKEVWEGSQ